MAIGAGADGLVGPRVKYDESKWPRDVFRFRLCDLICEEWSWLRLPSEVSMSSASSTLKDRASFDERIEEILADFASGRVKNEGSRFRFAEEGRRALSGSRGGVEGTAGGGTIGDKDGEGESNRLLLG